MGTVWQAHEEVLGRDVAVKEVLPPPDVTGPERDVFTVRSFREARAAGRVARPCVAAVYDVLEEPGHPWNVIELVRTRTLGELWCEERPLPAHDRATAGRQSCCRSTGLLPGGRPCRATDPLPDDDPKPG